MSSSYLKLWLIQNIQMNIPKDTAEIIKHFLFYDKYVSIHRKLTRRITATVKNPDIFVMRRCYNRWSYDQQLQIYGDKHRSM